MGGGSGRSGATPAGDRRRFHRCYSSFVFHRSFVSSRTCKLRHRKHDRIVQRRTTDLVRDIFWHEAGPLQTKKEAPHHPPPPATLQYCQQPERCPIIRTSRALDENAPPSEAAACAGTQPHGGGQFQPERADSWLWGRQPKLACLTGIPMSRSRKLLVANTSCKLCVGLRLTSRGGEWMRVHKWAGANASGLRAVLACFSNLPARSFAALLSRASALKNRSFSLGPGAAVSAAKHLREQNNLRRKN